MNDGSNAGDTKLVTAKKRVSGQVFRFKNIDQAAYLSGNLNLMINPVCDGLIRQPGSYFVKEKKSGLWELAKDMPMLIETRFGIVESRCGCVEQILSTLPEAYALCSSMLDSNDTQMVFGIFGDSQDRCALNGLKLSSEAKTLCDGLVFNIPGVINGDSAEEIYCGLFGAAYMTNARINHYGLKYYDFTVSDSWVQRQVSSRQTTRIYGVDAFTRASENGHCLSQDQHLFTKDIVKSLLDRAHAFFIQVGYGTFIEASWCEAYGSNRVILIDNLSDLPYVQALVIGLTEGTVSLSGAISFLRSRGVERNRAAKLVESVSHIPINAQLCLRKAVLRQIPIIGDLFNYKTDIWPITVEEQEVECSYPPTIQLDRLERVY